MPEYYDRYINLIEDISLDEALNKYGYNLYNSVSDKLKELGNKVYSEKKWTINEIIQHVIDSERVFNYRALRFARNDDNELPGFDENKYVPESDADKRTLIDLLNEFEYVRLSTITLFRSFSDEMLYRSGISSGKNISVLAIGFVIAGHSLHHFNTIKERYFPLLI